ncbi:MAG TPA: NADH-ubiquinone oxidoreductase-F iron-sulfur binding region domain-containing protein, partial [Anaerolineales bacterium]|nr:NADH-ubiquinone oxidoreductase-F iron-sulfur binding region domain-containing protein [Anaerolineales bacterium]
MSTKIDLQNLPVTEEFAPLAEGVCPVEWALERVAEARLISCGRSVTCRDGLTQVQAIITDITTGAGQPGDLAMLRDVVGYIAA